jgi:uncharacterized protein
MFRHAITATTILVSTGLLSSCNQAPSSQPESVSEPVVTASESPLVSKATTLVDHIMAGNFGPVIAEFDATMTAAMPESLLSTTMAQLGQQVGNFKARTSTREASEAGYDVVYVTTVFEKATLNAKVVYDANGKVAGLFFQP